MQTDSLPEARSAWPRWAEFLRRHGLEDATTWLLEAAGPLAVIGAQALYIGGPLFRPALTEPQCNALGHLLEDREESQAFIRYLREEGSL